MSEIEEIIKFAIDKEEEAYNLYFSVAKTTNSSTVKKLMEELANDELGHKKLLEDLQDAEELLDYDINQVVDLKLSDHLIAHEIDENSDFQSVLTFAMKEEKAAYDLYFRMSKAATTDKHVKIFQKLGQMELTHKNKLESLYDDMFYSDN
ncbi:MAG: ferritin family protein [Promethearchaeota archaeon]